MNRITLPPDSPLLAQMYRLASHLTDPLCRAHRHVTELSLYNRIHPEEGGWEAAAHKTALVAQIVIAGSFAMLTSPCGVSLRAMANSISAHSYLHRPGQAVEIPLPTQPTFLCWNVCGIPGGFVYTDGGVAPWWERVDQICRQIEVSGVGVAAISEVFDIQMAERMIAQMSTHFSHFYFCAGSQALGPGSGLLLMTRYSAQDVRLIRFPEAAHYGRATGKAYFRFQLGMMKVIFTHLQHSERPMNPVPGEVAARVTQSLQILREIDRGAPTIVLGDLNMDPNELQKNPLCRLGQLIPAQINSRGKHTWGGDAWCATATGKPVSTSRDLDYVLMQRVRCVAGSLLETGFDGACYRPYATSDHLGVRVTLEMI